MGQTQCTSEVFQVSDIENAVFQALKKELSLLDSMAVKIGAGDDNPAADSCCVAGKMVCGISASLFGMVFLSAGQCAIGNGDAFVPDAAITGDGSTSNADRWIRDFYDTAGGRQRDRASGTGGSNASAGMVHIK